MNIQNYTSLKLSKLLAENGFDKEKEAEIFVSENGNYITDEEYWDFQDYAGSVGMPAGSSVERHYPSYDILNDLCVKYAKEIFGEAGYYSDNKFTGIKTMREASNRIDEFKEGLYYQSFEEKAETIFHFLQQNKKQEAEDYIIKHSIIFKKRVK